MKLDHVGWNFGILTPHFRTKCWALKVKQVISKYLENQKEKGIVQIAYFLKNMHRTCMVQYHIGTNQEQISGCWGNPILSSPLSTRTRKWLNPMIQSRLSFLARSYFQDLIYICHTQQGSFDHTYLDRQQADFPWKYPQETQNRKDNHKTRFSYLAFIGEIPFTPLGGGGRRT